MPCADADRESLRAALERAVAQLEADGLVAFPTETTWGLAASARSERAVERLRGFKGRDPGQPISVIVSSPAPPTAVGWKVSINGMG